MYLRYLRTLVESLGWWLGELQSTLLLNMRPVWKTHEGSSTSSDVSDDVSDEEEF